MAFLARASAQLALLAALAGTSGAPAMGAAAFDRESGECAAGMRVELLQRSPGKAGLLQTSTGSNATTPIASAVSSVKYLTMIKSTLAVSNIHAGKSMAFKRFFLPVESEQEPINEERFTFKEMVKNAIQDGAALPDKSEYSSEKFDIVSWKEDCGKGARVRLTTVLGQGYDEDTGTYGGGMSSFSLHGVYSEGYGEDGQTSHREVGGLKVRQVERIFQEELGSLDQYSPWMDMHVAMWDNDLDGYAHRLLSYGVSFLALRWPASGLPADQPSIFYSLIFNTPDTQEIFEIISATAPSDPRLVLKEFPMTRHVFYSSDLTPLTGSTGPTPLHVSRSHYDLDAVKEFYWKFFQMKPVFEERDADTGVSFVSFWHQSPLAESVGEAFDADIVRMQVMYWNRPDQSMTLNHKTEWLERKLESLNSEYLRSSTCWPVWGDNHYSISTAPSKYWLSVKGAYDAAGIGYQLFRSPTDETKIFAGYFPLPGGMYIEFRPEVNTVDASPDVAPWIGDDTFTGTGAAYCFRFTCPA